MANKQVKVSEAKLLTMILMSAAIAASTVLGMFYLAFMFHG